MSTNTERAERIQKALEFYKLHCLSECGPTTEDELVGFLTDAMHWACARRVAFNQCVELAREDYLKESTVKGYPHGNLPVIGPRWVR